MAISEGQYETSGKKLDKLGQERCDIRTGEDKWGKTQGQKEKRKTKCRKEVRKTRKHTGKDQKSMQNSGSRRDNQAKWPNKKRYERQQSVGTRQIKNMLWALAYNN